MQKRAVRVVVLAVLLAAGGGAAYAAITAAGRLASLDAADRDVAARLDRVLAAAADVAAAQHAYVAPGQPPADADRVAALLEQIARDGAAARPQLQSTAAAGLLGEIADASQSLAAADGRARESLQLGQDLMAADVIYGDAAAATAAITARASALRTAEREAFAAEREAYTRQAWTAVVAAGGVWALGLIVLTFIPAAAPQAQMLPPAPVFEPLEGTPASAPTAPPASAIDLRAASALCVEISRLTDTGEIGELLGRAASVIDAAGVILWMGAGDELFAVAAHGYDPRIISRMGPIARGAENATAGSWRSCELRTVAGDMLGNGAIVAPLLRADGCVGVLAAEVRHGREADPATCAVTAMLASQLAAAVSAWPAASTAEVDGLSTGPAERRSLDADVTLKEAAG